MNFSIADAAADGIIAIEVFGFWSADDVADFARVCSDRATTVRRKWGRVRTVIDARRADVQSAATMSLDDTRALLSDGPDDRIAVVLTSALLKMQIQRTNASVKLRFFESCDQARAWLTEATATESMIIDDRHS